MDLVGSLIVLLSQPQRWPEIARVHRDAGLYPEALPVPALDLGAHRRAWLRAMVRDAPTMVLCDVAVLVPGAELGLAQTAQALGDAAWDVLHLDAARQGDAYVVTAPGAALLVEAADELEGSSVTALLADADVNVVAVDPAVAVIASSAPTVPEGAVVVASDLELAVAQEVGDLVPTLVDDRSVGTLVPVGGRLLDATTGHPALVLVGDPSHVGSVVAAARASDADGFGALLRYDGALPGSLRAHRGRRRAGEPAVLDPEFCATVIRAAEALGAWTADPTDPVPGHEVSLAVLCPRLFAHVEDHVAALVVPRLRYHWPTLEFHGLRDAFVIKYTRARWRGLAPPPRHRPGERARSA